MVSNLRYNPPLILANIDLTAPVSKPSTTLASLTRLERLQLLAYFAGFIVLGISAALLGPTLNQLATNTGSTLGDISVLFTMRSVGYLIGAVLSAFLYERFGGHRVMALAFVGTAISLFFTPVMPTLWLLSAVTLLSRLTGGIIDTGENTLIVWSLGKRVGPYMNALHLTFGLGAFAAPLLAAWALIQFGGVHAAYWIVAGLALPVAVFVWRLPNPVRSTDQPTTLPTTSDGVAHVATHKTSAMPLVLILLFDFFYVGGEVTLGGWLYNYALATKISDTVGAAALASAFWGAYTLGRLVSIPASLRWSSMQILSTGAVGAVISAIGMWQAQGNLWLTWVGVIALGLSMASLFPTMLAYAETRLTMTGRVTSSIMASASIGATVTPWLVGQVLGTLGPAAVPIAALVSAVLMCGVLVGLLRTQTQ